jgi:amino acid transporter
LAFHNSSARYFFSLGREGLLPARFGKTHGVHQSPHLGSLLQSALAVVVVTAFVLSGVDPVLSLFSWLTNVSTLCILALMALAALAVVVFFTKEKGLAEPAFKVKVLPAVSGVILLAILILAIANFSVLTGADPVVAWLLVATLPVAAVVGVLVARNLKKNNAEAYQAIGQNRSV